MPIYTPIHTDIHFADGDQGLAQVPALLRTRLTDIQGQWLQCQANGSNAKPMAPMPSQWIQSVPSPQRESFTVVPSSAAHNCSNLCFTGQTRIVRYTSPSLSFAGPGAKRPPSPLLSLSISQTVARSLWQALALNRIVRYALRGERFIIDTQEVVSAYV